MNEYYKNPKGTTLALENSRLLGSDIGMIDNDGFVKITGRKKNFFKLVRDKYQRLLDDAVDLSSL